MIRKIARSVREFRIFALLTPLFMVGEVTCECVQKWKNYMASEVMLGTAADLDRGFDSDLMIRR